MPPQQQNPASAWTPVDENGGWTPVDENDIPPNSVTQTGNHFQGPHVVMPYSMRTLAQGAGDVGTGALKGAGSTLNNIGSMLLPDRLMRAAGMTPPTPEQTNDLFAPTNTAQAIGKGAEQAGEFMLPGGAEEELAAKAPAFLGKTLPKIGAQALSSGVVNKVQGGTFGGGAAGGAIAGGIGRGLQALAPTWAETALNVRNVDRGFSKTPGKAILNDTRGVRPATIAKTANDSIDTLTQRLEDAAANSGLRASTDPAINVIDDAIVKKAAQNSPMVDDLQSLRNQLTVNRLTGRSIPTDQSATGVLNLKRGVNDTIGRWLPEQQKGIKGVSRQVYGALDNELDRVTPESAELNQRISSLIPVGARAGAADLNANLLQRSMGRFGRHTGALTLAGLGAAEGGHKGGTPGAIVGGLTGLFAPEVLASPTVNMIGARSLNALSQPIARYSSGIAQQLFRMPKTSQ